MVKCYAPWGYLIVDVNGDVRPCCFHSTSLGNLYCQSVEKIWNGEGYRNLRKSMKEDSFDNDCMICSTKVAEFVIENLEISDFVFVENYFQNRKEFFEERLFLESSPLFYSVTTSTDCNLNCSFCSQNVYRNKNISSLSSDLILALSSYFKYARILSWCGGETLIQKPFLDFVEDFDPSVYQNMYFEITTNGTLFTDELFNELKKFKKVFIIFSIDGGTKEVYEKIRVGANWETVTRNLARAKRMKNVIPTVQYTVMKSNIMDIGNAVMLFNKLGIEVVFYPIIGKELVEENIFYYPDLLKEMDWENSINSSLRIAIGNSKETLKKIKLELIKAKVLWGGLKDE